MEVGWAKSQRDLEEIADGMARVFTRKSYFDFYRRRLRYMETDPYFRPEHCRVVKENGRIVSHVGIIEKPVYVGEAEVRVAGIGDVYTLPDARGKGYSRLLMEDALRYMRAQGYPLTMLYGIPNYYHKFGYLEAVREYRLEVKCPPEIPRSRRMKFRVARKNDVPELQRLYANNFHGLPLTVVRTEAYWRRFLDEPERFLVATTADGKTVGYAHLKDEFTGEFLINEAATEGREISLAILAEVARRLPAGGAPVIPVRMAPSMPFVRHVRELGSRLVVQTFAEGQGNGMLAIVALPRLIQDLFPALEARLQRSEYSNFSGRVHLKCGQESLLLTFDSGSPVHLETESGGSTVVARLICDHRFFVRNVVGYWSIADLVEQGHGRVNSPEAIRLFDVLFPRGEPFMLPLDYF